MGNLLQVTDANFAEALKAPRAVIEFWATWCPACKAAAPMMERLATTLKSQVLVVGADVDQAPQAADSYSIASIPTMILFADGKEVHRINGVGSYAETLKEICSSFGGQFNL